VYIRTLTRDVHCSRIASSVVGHHAWHRREGGVAARERGVVRSVRGAEGLFRAHQQRGVVPEAVHGASGAAVAALPSEPQAACTGGGGAARAWVVSGGLAGGNKMQQSDGGLLASVGDGC